MSTPSSKNQPLVIFYRYKESPFAHKVDLLLAIRKIPHFTVLVPRMPPRSDLLLLGIAYRRVPVLAINDTVYCDTFRIAEALEALYPDSEDHPSLFPKNLTNGAPGQVATQKLLAQFWTDRSMFKLTVGLVPWKLMPKEIIQDRASMLGGTLDVDALAHLRPYTISQLKVHLALLDQQLEESGNLGFHFATPYPGFLDVSAYFALNWLQELGIGEELFGNKDDQTIERVRKWMKQVREFYEQSKVHSQSTVISGEEANKKIPEPENVGDLKALTADERLFGLGGQVSVVPDDSGLVPTTGRLVEINQSNIALIVRRNDGSGRVCKRGERTSQGCAQVALEFQSLQDSASKFPAGAISSSP